MLLAPVAAPGAGTWVLRYLAGSIPRSRMRLSSATLLVVASLSAATARAQMSVNPVQDYINKTTLLNNILSNARANEMIRAQTNGAAGAKAPTRPAAPAPAATAFRHSGQSILPAMIAQRSANAANRGQLQNFLEAQLQLYNRTATTDGFPPNELAYAMEYFIVNSYMIVHDLHDVPYEKDPRVKRGKDSFDRITIINEKKTLKPTMTQERAVYNQMQTALAANPGVMKLNDAERQQMTEMLAIMFGMNYAAYMQGINAENDQAIEQARASARLQLERLLGMPADRIKIDDTGVRQ